MPYTVKAKQNMIGALQGGAANLYAGLATNTAGTTEVTGGSPAYARAVITLGAADGSGVRTVTTGATLNVPAGTSVAAIAIYDAATAGNLLAYVTLRNAGNTADAPEVYTTQGTYTVATGGTFDLNG